MTQFDAQFDGLLDGWQSTVKNEYDAPLNTVNASARVTDDGTYKYVSALQPDMLLEYRPVTVLGITSRCSWWQPYTFMRVIWVNVPNVSVSKFETLDKLHLSTANELPAVKSSTVMFTYGYVVLSRFTSTVVCDDIV